MTEKTKKSQAVSLSQSKVEKLKNGNLEITITIPREIISSEYQKSLQNLARETKIKGFRPGKAPLALAEKSIGKEKIYQEIVTTLFTQVYLEAIKTHQVTPIVNPKISIINSEESKDWIIKALTASLPDFKLGNYQDEVKKALAPEKIWIPGKDQAPKPKEKESEEQKLATIFRSLLANIKIDLPQILIEEEVNRMLSRLIDQTARLGLTVEQYLNSISKTIQELKNEYQKQAEDSTKLELILSAIADQEKVQVDEEEIDKMIQATGDEKIKKSLQSATQKSYLRQILRKRKVIDSLLRL